MSQQKISGRVVGMHDGPMDGAAFAVGAVAGPTLDVVGFYGVVGGEVGWHLYSVCGSARGVYLGFSRCEIEHFASHRVFPGVGANAEK